MIRDEVERKNIASKLRQMADRVEDDSFGCLTLRGLAMVWGNEFWELIYFTQYDALKTVGETLSIMKDLVIELRESRK